MEIDEYEKLRHEYLASIQVALNESFPPVRLPHIFRSPDGPIDHIGFSSLIGHHRPMLVSEGQQRVIENEPKTMHQLILPFNVPGYEVSTSDRGLIFFPGVKLEWQTYALLLRALRKAGVLSPSWHDEIHRRGYLGVNWPEIGAPTNLELPALHPAAAQYIARAKDTAKKCLEGERKAKRRVTDLEYELENQLQHVESLRRERREAIQRQNDLQREIFTLQTELDRVREEIQLTAATQW